MKKNYLVIAVLAMALLGTVGLINKANAQNADITLEVQNGTFNCSLYPTAVAFGITTASPTDTLLTGDVWTDSFACTNYLSVRATPMTVQSTDLTGSDVGLIDASNITWTPTAAIVETAGDCSDLSLGLGGTLDASRELITKAGTNVCDFTWTPADEMTVNVPAYSPVESYQAVMTITDPA